MTSGLFPRLQSIIESEISRRDKAKRIAAAIRAAGHYRWVGIYDVDRGLGLVKNIGWSGPGPPDHPAFAVTEGITSRAITNAKAVNVGDVRGDPDYLTALSTTRSEIIIPVCNAQGEVVGTIDVESDRLHAFDPPTERLLEDCARILTPFWTLESSD